MTAYDDIGLGTNLIKELPKIYDVDLAIDDESIWGIKLAKKSVALDRLYGDNLQVGGSSNISGYISIYNSAMAKISQLDDTGYHGYDTGGTERVTFNTTNGIRVIDDSSGNVFKTVISGTDVGDVQIGTYDGTNPPNAGLYYDKNTNTLYVSGSLQASEIRIGTAPAWFRADSSGNIWSGALNLPTAIANTFAVTNAGALYAQSATISGALTTTGGSSLNGGYLQLGTVQADKLSVSLLSAITANMGNVVVGGSGDVLGTVSVRNSANTEIAKLNNSGVIIRNTRGLFFEQTGGGQYWDFQVNASNQAVTSLPTTNQFFMKDYSGTTNLFTVSDTKTYSEKDLETNSNLIWYDSKLSSGRSRYVFKDTGGTERLSITPDASPNTRINMNGFELRLTSNKTAIMPTSDGYKALYCAEAPEVWFFDFVGEDKVTDPLFDEVTEGESKYVQVVGGGYQVWRKRKGKSDLRFTPKTAEQFERNEVFYNQAN